MKPYIKLQIEKTIMVLDESVDVLKSIGLSEQTAKEFVYLLWRAGRVDGAIGAESSDLRKAGWKFPRVSK